MLNVVDNLVIVYEKVAIWQNSHLIAVLTKGAGNVEGNLATGAPSIKAEGQKLYNLYYVYYNVYNLTSPK